MSQPQPEITPHDAVQLAQTAIERINELEDVVETQQELIQQLENRVEQLETQQPENQEYSQLDRETKVGLVQQHLLERAQERNGKAAIEYDDVQWGVFDGEPSADHCYTLMQRAATADGFEYQTPSDGNIRLTVNTARTKSNAAFSHANNER